MVILLSFVGWLLSAIAFEYAFDMALHRNLMNGSKSDLTKVYWLVLAVIAIATGGGYWWCQVITMLPVAVSHIDLAERNTQRVRLKQVVENIPAAIRRFTSRLSDLYR